MLVKTCRALRRAAVVPLALSLVAANCGLAAENPPPPSDQAAVAAAADTPLIEKTGKSKPLSAESKPAEAQTPAAGGDEAGQTGTSSSTKAWIWGGLGAVAAVAIVAAVAAGGGGGGSSAAPDNGNNSGTGTGTGTDSGSSGGTTPGGCPGGTPVNTNPRPAVTDNPSTTPVCAAFSGSWSGRLDLIGDNSLSVSATVAQDGGKIQITTSSNKAYGKLFIGTVGPDCNLQVYDQTTGEVWSTQSNPATANRIAIYAYADVACYGYTKLDALTLTR